MRLGPYRLLEDVDPRSVIATWRAKHDALGRPAFVRAVRSAAPSTSASARELQREACALARLDHDAVLRLYEFEPSDGGPWLAFEDPCGFTLASILAAAPRLAPEVAVAVALGGARGLAHAHERGVVHRSFSPRALILSSNGSVKLGEFGAAHIGGLADSGEAVESLGRTDYMAPEQILAEAPAPSADVFALGVVLWEMLAGTHPFASEAGAPADVARRIRSAQAAPLHPLVPAVPRAFERIALRCLAKRPDERYPNGGAVVAALASALADVTVATEPALVRRALVAARLAPEPPGPELAPSLAPRPAFPLTLSRSRRAVVALLALLAAGVFAFGLALGDRGCGAPRIAGGAGSAVVGPRGYVRALAHPWAEVVIDGVLIDVTPIGRPIPVAPGRHDITFRHPSAPDEQRTVEVAAAQTVVLDVTMRVARVPRVPDAGSPSPSSSDSP